MKRNYYPLLLAITSFLLLLNIYQYKCTSDLLAIEEQEQPVFIWNDDLEGIPVDHSLILLEYTSNDTIYLGSADNYDSPEYQFTVTDDSISVSDFGRHVGTVKIEGQLEKLINQDNE